MKFACGLLLLALCCISSCQALCREALKPRYSYPGCSWKLDSDSDGCQIYATKCDASADRTCFLKQDAGTGSGTNLRYYFDPRYNRCFPLFYSGAGGNKNNFESREACAQACHPEITDTIPESDTI